MRGSRLFFPPLLALCCWMVAVTLSFPVIGAAQSPRLPVEGMVTMVDLGAKKCVPCKMMAPILVELEKEYEGRAAIHFIDVWEKPDQAKHFGIRLIPTQIFYDSQGREVARHEGFMAKKDIIDQLRELGVE